VELTLQAPHRRLHAQQRPHTHCIRMYQFRRLKALGSLVAEVAQLLLTPPACGLLRQEVTHRCTRMSPLAEVMAVEEEA
jgi:hypothetical protein